MQSPAQSIVQHRLPQRSKSSKLALSAVWCSALDIKTLQASQSMHPLPYAVVIKHSPRQMGWEGRQRCSGSALPGTDLSALCSCWHWQLPALPRYCNPCLQGTHHSSSATQGDIETINAPQHCHCSTAGTHDKLPDPSPCHVPAFIRDTSNIMHLPASTHVSDYTSAHQ